MLSFNQPLVQSVILIAWCRENYSFGNYVIQLLCTCAFWITLLLALLTYDYDYWVKMRIFSPQAWPFVGHIWTIVAFKEHSGLFFKRTYDAYKSKKLIGIHQFFSRTVLVCEPELIRRMCVNDFQHFTDRGFGHDAELDPLTENVVFLTGNRWKSLRSKVSPIFSPVKLKGMIPILDETASKFLSKIKDMVESGAGDGEKTKGINREDTKAEVGGSGSEVEIEKVNSEGKVLKSSVLFEWYTGDAIVSCALGVKSNFMDDLNDPIALALGAFYENSFRNVLNKALHYFCPKFSVLIKIRNVPKKTHDFFSNVVLNVIRERNDGVQGKRGDLIDTMLAMQCDERNHNVSADKEGDVKITDMVISANAFIVLLGGYETTSSTLAFLFLELAEQPEIQEKMRAEIKQELEKHGGKITNEMLHNLTYMDMVIQETLRLYPPFPSIQRLCTKDYPVPGTDLIIERDTLVIFPNLGIHRDDQYYENACSFIPERWSEERPQPAPGVYMPFGEGPRFCIGKRFAMLQMKCCLVKLLPRVQLSPAVGVGGASGGRREPFAADLNAPMTLHPADARVTITML